MTDVNDAGTPPNKLKKTLFSLALGCALGFAGSFGFHQFADTGALGELGRSREIAALVGLVYFIISLTVLAGVVVPKAGASFLNVEDAEELREQKNMLGMSGIGMASVGAALIVAALAAPMGPIGQGTALFLFVALMALGVVTSLASHKRQDELMRTVSKQAGSIAFYLMFFVAGGWALAAHLEYAAAPQPLDWLTMLYSLGLLAAFVASAKHGMMKMR